MKPKISCSKTAPEEMGGCSITIEGLTKEQQKDLEAMMIGYKWVKVKNGELEAVSAFEETPTPEEDPVITPHWPNDKVVQKNIQKEIICSRSWPPFSPSFYISHLCGYNYTPEDYKKQVKVLESFGFKCMRSRRGRNGRYWEIWYLPGLICAKGKLKEEVRRLENKKDKEIKEEIDKIKQEIEQKSSYFCKACYCNHSPKHNLGKVHLDHAKEISEMKIKKSEEFLNNIVQFFCKNVSFGSLDIVAQRAAMVLD